MSGGVGEADADAAAEGTSAGDSDSGLDSMLRKIAHVSYMSADPPLPRVGQVIGEKYRIDARLGRGGMGVVFRATHVVSRKAVALKWMLRSTTDGSAHKRFLREAFAAGRIDHPNVVDVYDVGQEGQCAYLVMELLHGEALRARLDRGRLESREAIDLLLPALRGVSAAHRAGVIHRDLKPDNVFLCTDPEGAPREAKVLDFGVSVVIAQSTLDPTLTDGATILGTPAYMSPEQLASARDTDERTDVYAFGVMLYEALTGQLPFVADSYSGLVLAVAHHPPQPPSELCRDIPRELERVILQALAKQRQDRPQTVDALYDRLLPFGSAPQREARAQPGARAQRGDGQAPQAEPAQRSARSGRNLSRAPVAVACGLALVLLGRAAYRLTTDAAPASLPSPSAPPSTAPSPAYLPAAAEPLHEPDEPERALAPATDEGVEKATSATSATGSVAPPRSCEEARRAGQSADGLRRIDPDGNGPLRAFTVYCAGMAGAGNGERAREYLPLAADAARNSTRFRYGQSTCPCPDLVRTFTRVRIEPSTLAVDPLDGTFARYDRSLGCERQHRHQCGESTNLAWGGAGSCRDRGDSSGSASIDLSGTGFAFAPDAQFVPAGFGAAGSAVFSADRRSATLSGGGLCGSLVPEHGSVRLVAAR
ncbi:MAG TPA: protein kinase [Polyangiaceae bacterium]|nr:protein kinase [Polyangiaceae bacterium]